MLKFNSDTIGALVRPRILLKVLTSKADQPLSIAYTRNQQAQALEHLSPTGNIQDLFKDLKLGDTTQDLSQCYVGKVVSYILFFPNKPNAEKYEKVGLERMKQLEKVAKNRRGRHWEVRAVGIQFYLGIHTEEDTGYIYPINPWPCSDGLNKEWFYFPEDIVHMDDIIRYERLGQGMLLKTDKAAGLVVTAKTLNKPQFYRTSSWTCKSIVILSCQHGRLVKVLPSRKFEIGNPLVNIDIGEN